METPRGMRQQEPELVAALRPVVTAFEALGIQYCVGGSVASGVFGEPRQTLDADLVAAVLGKHVAPLAERLKDQFYVDEPMMLRAITAQSSFNLIHLPTMLKVDVFVSWRSEFAQSELGRRIRASISREVPLEVFLASPEDIILAKLDWYRQGGGTSDRQWRDVLGVLKVQGERLDRAYLREWAARLNVADLLRHALEDAGLSLVAGGEA
jgi:hypothetical protein